MYLSKIDRRKISAWVQDIKITLSKAKYAKNCQPFDEIDQLEWYVHAIMDVLDYNEEVVNSYPKKNGN